MLWSSDFVAANNQLSHKTYRLTSLERDCAGTTHPLSEALVAGFQLRTLACKAPVNKLDRAMSCEQ